jgi:predicted ArsR family transcriptional regulator
MGKGKLTERQALIYRLLTDKGLTVRQVADALHISTQGVHDHLDLIRRKGYEVHNGKGAGNGTRNG